MYLETVNKFADLAAKKVEYQQKSPAGFFVGAMMAGAYVGLAIILIFTLGNDAPPAFRRLIMGACFGISLTLVIFAGSELFTGYTMYMSLGWLRGRTTLKNSIKLCALTWLGNLAGALLVSSIFIASGGGNLVDGTVLYEIVGYKMRPPALQIFAKGVLCNWLVCLAVWMTARTTSDAAKCILIFWCLLGFIASGYEHSVANMTGLSIGVMGGGDPTVNLAGWGHNLLWSTLGNSVSGVLFMGVAYWFASRSSISEEAAQDDVEEPATALRMSGRKLTRHSAE
jgi:nitrite transporter NirC